MSSNIHVLIKNEYQKRQKFAYDELQLKIEELYSKVPEIEKIDKEIRNTGLNASKNILLGISKNAGSNDLKERMDILTRKKESLLEEKGYNKAYLTMKFNCNKCNDTGYINISARLEKCSCYKQQLIEHLSEHSNLKLIEKENFSSFNIEYFSDLVDQTRFGISISPRQNITNIKNRCVDFIETFSKLSGKNLFFSGSTGTGKTFMTNCIAKELIDNGHTVLYQTAPVLFNTISEYRMKSLKDDDFQTEAYKNIFDCELLIIDDLGTESQTAARYAELLTILNTRQINNTIKPCKTILSTNLGAKKMEEFYTERVVSRIIGDFEKLNFSGNDLRRIKT